MRQIYGLDDVPVYGPRCWDSVAVRTAMSACSSGMRTVCISRASHRMIPMMISSTNCLPWCAMPSVPVLSWPVSTVCSIQRRRRFSWIAISKILVNAKINVVDYNATEFGIPINSRSIGTITLATSEVPKPVALRYAWHSWGPAPLFNSDDLPAQPFRLDLTTARTEGRAVADRPIAAGIASVFGPARHSPYIRGRRTPGRRPARRHLLVLGDAWMAVGAGGVAGVKEMLYTDVAFGTYRLAHFVNRTVPSGSCTRIVVASTISAFGYLARRACMKST